jgi:hypothetical protein
MKLRLLSFVLLGVLAFSVRASAAPWPPTPAAGSTDAKIYMIINKVTEIIGQVTTLQAQVAAIPPPVDLTPLQNAIAELQSRLQDVSRSGDELLINTGFLRITHNFVTGNGLTVQLTNAANGVRGIDVAQAGVGPGVFATSNGNAVWGITPSISSAGVIGDNTPGEAVVGRNRGGLGVGAVVGRNDDAGYGVRGFNTQNGIGVLGQAGISGGTGVGGRFENVNAANTSDALQVVTNSAGNAARFTGNVVINGNLTVSGTVAKGGGAFQIDHPLDPENKFLYHSFVESPEMMNVYNGVIRLNDSGEATVDLPNYFEALNRDYRYHLTAVGAPCPNLHVAEEVRHNRFKIAGGAPGAKVSWQVTGVRQDDYANAHRIPVEVDKPASMRGHLLSEGPRDDLRESMKALEVSATTASGADLPR